MPETPDSLQTKIEDSSAGGEEFMNYNLSVKIMKYLHLI